MARILIFTVHAGGGHLATSKAVSQYLKEDHDVYQARLFRDVLKRIDPFLWLTNSKKSLSDLYNYCASKQWYLFINCFSFAGLLLFPILKRLIKPLIYNFIKRHKPDIIISVIPVFNGIFAQVAEQFDIPFIVIPTDFDMRWFLSYWYPYKNLFFLLPFDKPWMWDQVERKIPAEHIIPSGFAIRKDFFEPKNKELIRKKWNLQPTVPVILLIMGGEGSDALIKYTEELTNIAYTFHLLVCIGRYETVRPILEKIQRTRPEHIKMTIIGFTQNIADLMAIADITISKAGSVSVAEALYSTCPLLLDATTWPRLHWEKYNYSFIEQQHFGNVINCLSSIRHIVTQYLIDPHLQKQTKSNITLFHKERCDKHIVSLVKFLEQKKTRGKA